MRLLDTSTFELHEFYGSKIPSYAILSHRWTGQEVSFHDMKDRNGLRMPGFAKIKGCCAHAASEGWQYAWIDSCCIDKSSSAELTEAINSMFKWYNNAEVCYAYLLDVPDDGEDPCGQKSSFRKSQWFRRGWTLQELLAPSTVVFFNCNWVEIGTKSSLYDTVIKITRIKQLANFKEASVAQKMSWAARRQTTRSEDMAYCLMGLFSVHMPLLYGEGKNAFKRLQLEILNNTDDETLFAWNGASRPWLVNQLKMSGLLAYSPTAFEDSGDVQMFEYGRGRPPFAMTNKGLRIELDLIDGQNFKFPQDHFEQKSMPRKLFLAPLNAKREKSANCLWIHLKKLDEGIFQRLGFDLISWPWEMEEARQIVHIKQFVDNGTVHLKSQATFLIRHLALSKSNFSMTYGCINQDGHDANRDYQVNETQELESTLKLEFCYSAAGAIMFSKNDTVRFVLICTVNKYRQAGIDILVAEEDQTLKEIFDKFIQEESNNTIRQPYGTRPLSLDRTSKPVGGGVIVSARLGKIRYRGQQVSVIDFTVVET